MIKKITMTFLAAVSVLALSNAALADYQMASGGAASGDGRDYAYEIWSDNQNTTYTLKVWPKNDYPNGSFWTHSFRSSIEAFNYFDCNYAKKSLPVCPKS